MFKFLEEIYKENGLINVIAFLLFIILGIFAPFWIPYIIGLVCNYITPLDPPAHYYDISRITSYGFFMGLKIFGLIFIVGAIICALAAIG